MSLTIVLVNCVHLFMYSKLCWNFRPKKHTKPLYMIRRLLLTKHLIALPRVTTSPGVFRCVSSVGGSGRSSLRDSNSICLSKVSCCSWSGAGDANCSFTPWFHRRWSRHTPPATRPLLLSGSSVWIRGSYHRFPDTNFMVFFWSTCSNLLHISASWKTHLIC